MRLLVEFLFCFIFFQFTSTAQAVVFKFTKISCESRDVDYVTFDYCFLKEVNQNENAINIKYKLHKLPVKELNIKHHFMVKSHGKWVTFLYDIEIDACKFFKKRYNSFAKLVLGFLDGHTNLNSGCPINHDIVITNLSSMEISKQLRGIPFGKAHYAMFVNWTAENKVICETKYYIEVLQE